MSAHISSKYKEWTYGSPMPEGMLEDVAECVKIPHMAFYIGCDGDNLIHYFQELSRGYPDYNIPEERFTKFFQTVDESTKLKVLPAFYALKEYLIQK